MRLLIVTQKIDINDDILGFFHRWVLEFAKHYEFITVIALEVGEYNLPENVKVLSLGKENTNTKVRPLSLQRSNLCVKIFSKIKYIFNFYRYILRERKNYDAVFVHMNPIYIVLGGLFWRLQRKKISLWYAHGSVSFGLRIAEKLSNIVFTSTRSGFRLKSKKIHVIGQGIDTEKFKPIEKIDKNNVFKIISIGRISPVKDYETLINAVDTLVQNNIQVTVEIIGSVGLSTQEKYFSQLKCIIKERNLEQVIYFVGAVSNNNIIKYLQQSDLFINTSHTGSLDKAILEAMATGLPVLTCNEALLGVLGDFSSSLMFKKGDTKALSEKIKSIVNMTNSDRISLGRNLRNIVEEDHNLTNFVNKISNILK